MSEKQFYLLQVNDALFPIGGYSHSQGLETYIQRGIVHDADTAREYITHKIKWNLAYTELLAARLAYEAAEKKDLQELLYLEELLEASRIPMEQREAARKKGSRFAKTIEKLGLSISETGIFREYLDARKGKAVNHCCIYGVFCAEMQIPLEEALTHYLYAQTSAIVTNCVKTIPLSQTSGQQLLSGCYGEFDEILKDIMRDVSGMKIGVAIVVATIGGSLVKGLLDLESFGWSMEIQSFVMLAISACVFFGIYGVVLLMTKEKLVWEIVGNYIEKK